MLPLRPYTWRSPVFFQVKSGGFTDENGGFMVISPDLAKENMMKMEMSPDLTKDVG